MAAILIKAGRIWDGEQFSSADVYIKDGRIEKIAKDITLPANFVFDATDQIVSAGLVDCHVHIKGIAPDRFGAVAEMISFPFGVTALNDAGSVQGDRARLDGFAVKSTVFVNTEIIDGRPDLAATEKLLAEFGDKAIGIKVYFDTKIHDINNIAPLKVVCDYARTKNLKVMVHCANSPTPMAEIVQTLSKGDILTHIYHGGQHTCTEDDFAAFKIAKERGVIMDAGFAGHAHTDFSVLKAAIQNGYLPDTISTDITRGSAYKRGGRYGMTMCMSIAKDMGMTEEDIFRAVTAAPACAFGKENEWGHLLEGRCADVAVLKYTDVCYSLCDAAGNTAENQKGYKCTMCVTNGEVVYRD